MSVWPADWGSILLPHISLVEIFFRVTVVYFVLLAALRIVSRRQLGHLAISDLLLLVLLASAVRLGLTGQDPSVGTALLAGAVLLFWEWVVDQLAYRSATLRSVFRKRAMPIIRDGRLLHENARSELLTQGEILEELRKQGIDSISGAAAAYLEPDGRMSVIPKK